MEIASNTAGLVSITTLVSAVPALLVLLARSVCVAVMAWVASLSVVATIDQLPLPSATADPMGVEAAGTLEKRLTVAPGSAPVPLNS
ncbi:MAG: hypothetical protein RIF33_00810, partial [Cyclobacteriaceae bacterium]